MDSSTRVLRALGVIALAAASCQAQSENNTEKQFWPELQVLWTFRPNLRLLFLQSNTRDRDVTYPNLNNETGIHLDFLITNPHTPRLFSKIVDRNDERNKLIVLRIGYRYEHSINNPSPVIEHRPLVEATFRHGLPARILASDRNRFEFRLIKGAYSWRYRNELKFEREVHVGPHLSLIPYSSTEAFYDSKVEAWDRFRFSVGADYPFGKHLTFEPYYTRQISTHTSIRYTNALGLTVKVFLVTGRSAAK
jgi:hypothetical protein